MADQVNCFLVRKLREIIKFLFDGIMWFKIYTEWSSRCRNNQLNYLIKKPPMCAPGYQGRKELFKAHGQRCETRPSANQSIVLIAEELRLTLYVFICLFYLLFIHFIHLFIYFVCLFYVFIRFVGVCFHLFNFFRYSVASKQS